MPIDVAHPVRNSPLGVPSQRESAILRLGARAARSPERPVLHACAMRELTTAQADDHYQLLARTDRPVADPDQQPGIGVRLQLA
jgi:hypothetical protein